MRTLALAMVAVLTACSSDEAVSPPLSEVGRYALVSVDGQNLPARVTEEDMVADVFSGTFDVISGGAAKITLEFQPVGEDMTTNVIGGRYTRRGDLLSFTWETGGETVGMLSRNELQMTNEGQLWLFRKI